MSLTENGAWCWFSDPRAIYYEGNYQRTYTGWMDSTGNVLIGCYDHDSKNIETKIVYPRFQVDDHDNPSLFIEKEGRLFVFCSKHATPDPIIMLKSTHPEDISDWEPARELALNDTAIFEHSSNTYTYTNIFQLEEEDNMLYLFCRGTDFKPNYSTSTDNGKTWSKGKILILPERI